ncbi:MAG: hypothetical protein ACI9J4_000001 [Paraglaciecola sp.]|jgi:hypothetical protein
MTSLIKPKLGTDSETGWKFYALHLSSSYIINEFFLVSNYKRCIKNSRSTGSKELSKWAVKMDEQEYHDLYVHSFIGMWSSFESGLVNIVADFIKNDRQVAINLSSKFKTGRFDVEAWPWNSETCLDLAQRIESKAKHDVENGGVDFFSRIQKLFSWLNISINVGEHEKLYLSEANRVRNILLHRYGVISEKDAREFSCLLPWVGSVMPLTKDKFTNYYNGISQTLISIMTGIASST